MGALELPSPGPPGSAVSMALSRTARRRWGPVALEVTRSVTIIGFVQSDPP